MRQFVVALLLATNSATGQSTAQTTAKTTCSISGVVTDTSGKPISGLMIFVPPRVETKTDAEGRYTLRDVAPGSVQVQAGSRIGPAPGYAVRSVTLLPGQILDSVNFRVSLKGSISGVVHDENKEPVPGLEVVLLGREYRAGSLHYYRRNATLSNDQGEYRLERVLPGEAFLVLARERNTGMKPISEAPANPKLRKRTSVPTYYPNSQSPVGGELITLRPGENREGIDIQVARSASYCVEGTLLAGGRPSEMGFWIHEAEISFGIGREGGATGIPPGGKTGPDGRIRVCGLHAGEYRLTAFSGDLNEPTEYGITSVIISDRGGDVQNVSVSALPRISVAGRVVLEGTPPEKPVASQLRILLTSMHRSMGSTMVVGRSAIPGEFTVSGGKGGQDPPMDDYLVRCYGVPESLYVKDILYGNASLLNAPLRLGSATADAELRVILGADAGFVQVRVQDKDGKPVPDAGVVLLPVAARSEAELVDMRTTGQADQNGDYQSGALPPGKYVALATESDVSGFGPELASKLWRSRSRAKELEITPKATQKLTLSPVSVD